MFIKGREKVEIKLTKYSKAFIGYSEAIDDLYENLEKNLEDYYPTKKRKVFIVFDDMIADMQKYKSCSPIVTGLFLRRRKPSISIFVKSRSCFKVHKTKTKRNTLFSYENT